MTTSLELHRRISDGVVAALRPLTFAGLFGGIQDDRDIEEANLELPCIVVSIDGEQEEILGGTTLKRHRNYPVRVFIIARDVLLPDEEAKILRWRETMMDRFDRPPRSETSGLVLPGCPEVYDTVVIPKVIFDERLPQYRYVVSGFVVKAAAFFARK